VGFVAAYPALMYLHPLKMVAVSPKRKKWGIINETAAIWQLYCLFYSVFGSFPWLDKGIFIPLIDKTAAPSLTFPIYCGALPFLNYYLL
jgi:hypothetical protein